jgi:hypothetical protein
MSQLDLYIKFPILNQLLFEKKNSSVKYFTFHCWITTNNVSYFILAGVARNVWSFMLEQCQSKVSKTVHLIQYHSYIKLLSHVFLSWIKHSNPCLQLSSFSYHDHEIHNIALENEICLSFNLWNSVHKYQMFLQLAHSHICMCLTLKYTLYCQHGYIIN